MNSRDLYYYIRICRHTQCGHLLAAVTHSESQSPTTPDFHHSLNFFLITLFHFLFFVDEKRIVVLVISNNKASPTESNTPTIETKPIFSRWPNFTCSLLLKHHSTWELLSLTAPTPTPLIPQPIIFSHVITHLSLSITSTQIPIKHLFITNSPPIKQHTIHIYLKSQSPKKHTLFQTKYLN